MEQVYNVSLSCAEPVSGEGEIWMQHPRREKMKMALSFRLTPQMTSYKFTSEADGKRFSTGNILRRGK